MAAFFFTSCQSGDALQRLAGAGEEEAAVGAIGARGFACAPSSRDQPRPAVAEVFLHCVASGFADGDEPLLVALSGDGDDAEIWVEVFEPEVGDFAGAQAAGVHELQHGAVAEMERGWRGGGAGAGGFGFGVFGGRGLGGFDELAHLSRREDAGELFSTASGGRDRRMGFR